MMDLAVINGLVFIEGGFRKADVGIKDGKFALIAEPGCLPEAERTIDAGGKYVLPGGIDTHVHYRDPGHWERESRSPMKELSHIRHSYMKLRKEEMQSLKV